MPAFITVAEFKAMPLPITDKQYEKVTDQNLEAVILAASDHLQDYMDRKILSASYTQRIPGNNRDFLILENRPVTALTTLTSVDMVGNVSGYDESGLIIESEAGIIRWIDSSRNAFFKGNWWVVTYVAGYSTVPLPIKHATALQTLEMLQPIFRGGSNFVEVELVEGINTQIVDLLEKYKNKRIG
jgi:hypothetical protein